MLFVSKRRQVLHRNLGIPNVAFVGNGSPKYAFFKFDTFKLRFSNIYSRQITQIQSGLFKNVLLEKDIIKTIQKMVW